MIASSTASSRQRARPTSSYGVERLHQGRLGTGGRTDVAEPQDSRVSWRPLLDDARTTGHVPVGAVAVRPRNGCDHVSVDLTHLNQALPRKPTGLDAEPKPLTQSTSTEPDRPDRRRSNGNPRARKDCDGSAGTASATGRGLWSLGAVCRESGSVNKCSSRGRADLKPAMSRLSPWRVPVQSRPADIRRATAPNSWISSMSTVARTSPQSPGSARPATAARRGQRSRRGRHRQERVPTEPGEGTGQERRGQVRPR